MGRGKRVREETSWICSDCGLAGEVVLVTDHLDSCVLETHPLVGPHVIRGAKTSAGYPLCPDCHTGMQTD